MKNAKKTISNPDELNKNLQYTSPWTWIILGLCLFALIGFFAWSCIYKIKVKISGVAQIKDKNVTLVIENKEKDKLKVGQKVYINNKEGAIISIKNNEPVVSLFDLKDGKYTYTVVLEEIKPIEFLFNKQ